MSLAEVVESVVPVAAEDAVRARAVVERHARDRGDLRLLLQMLGLETGALDGPAAR
ncbi:hypothetical protein [Kitasatospora sp. NPDC059571]|uniref:hypothetical protein n=1 Tax=Kitasatospora sp. NPDC059571 TaxID=3346871 RepID=UPI0036865CC3